MSNDWRTDVLKFWFGFTYDQWWKPDETVDRQVRERFHDLWAEKRRFPAHCFLEDPLTTLAGVILFDQFPRNMFRGHAEQFATDELALEIARSAVEGRLHEQLRPDERAFLYMPFQHSERLEDQRQSVLLFTELGDDRFLPFAIKHRDVIERFGRFPHRNAMLGRAPRPDELAAGDVRPW